MRSVWSKPHFEIVYLPTYVVTYLFTKHVLFWINFHRWLVTKVLYRKMKKEILKILLIKETLYVRITWIFTLLGCNLEIPLRTYWSLNEKGIKVIRSILSYVRTCISEYIVRICMFGNLEIHLRSDGWLNEKGIKFIRSILCYLRTFISEYIVLICMYKTTLGNLFSSNNENWEMIRIDNLF